MKRLCIIAARSGSKGLPDKNILTFAGKPLLAHSIEQALASNQFDCVTISSDSQAYIDIAVAHGATHPVLRHDTLSGDTVAKQPVLRHALETVEAASGMRFDTIVDLQPTSPLRRAEDIPGTIATLESNSSLANAISIASCKVSPYFNQVEVGEDGRLAIAKTIAGKAKPRRQDVPKSYQLNGSIYAWSRDGLYAWDHALTPASGYWEMPDLYSFDVDLALDFDLAAFIAETQLGWPHTPPLGKKV